MDTSSTVSWYQTLLKPSWAPPSWLFGPVWTILYLLIAISFGTVFYRVYRKKLKSNFAIPFALNLLFNFAFTPLQFGLQNNFLAAIDILLILVTLVWAMRIIYKKIPWVTLINIPYLLWVSFATILQLTVTYLNL
ncbi:MAG: CrtK protein, membrane protein-like protein [Candidatus Collierbacteria bacterium GW2011_GWC2_44_18]|uniref:CrtK protein, membrane protein-like protein n=2 Tax=Microgenomates group TaxID=1794810 RepID=A0A0G1M4Z6_9BACT|nr:MAG: CrtK protein, membrane protein-like protein [Candidatus Collierbacteria bacterium GW2011_GWC2_44_18]KKT67009.1 MAG: CrtK protein, membrane protein-like protein [Candidatus Woesebacteria bacterium GW2011_GWA2_44_33]